MEASLSHIVMALCTNVERTACMLEGWWYDPGFR